MNKANNKNTARADSIQKELDALGIVDIRADSGILTTGIINDAIYAARDLLNTLDIDSIADEIDNSGIGTATHE